MEKLLYGGFQNLRGPFRSNMFEQWLCTSYAMPLTPIKPQFSHINVHIAYSTTVLAHVPWTASLRKCKLMALTKPLCNE